MLRFFNYKWHRQLGCLPSSSDLELFPKLQSILRHQNLTNIEYIQTHLLQTLRAHHKGIPEGLAATAPSKQNTSRKKALIRNV